MPVMFNGQRPVITTYADDGFGNCCYPDFDALRMGLYFFYGGEEH